MTFRALPQHLHELALVAIEHFSREYGIPRGRFVIEGELQADIGYRPTIYAKKQDHTFVAIEVSEDPRPSNIEALILGCKNKFVPLKLWIVVPSGAVDALKPADLHFFRENGVGLLELSSNGASRQLAGPPVPLSLNGVRNIRYADFPARYREDLRSAYDTFVGGSPHKGCSIVYDEIENLTRRILKKASRIGALRRVLAFDPDTEAWSNVLAFLRANLDKVSCRCPDLSETLFNRLQGITEHRNETGHKPRSLSQQMERDRRLRTRFEAAMDELQGLIEASRNLRP